MSAEREINDILTFYLLHKRIRVRSVGITEVYFSIAEVYFSITEAYLSITSIFIVVFLCD